MSTSGKGNGPGTDWSVFEKGIDLFNEGKYFEAHEVWEELWLEEGQMTERQFLLGLIMTAAAFYRYERQECKDGGPLLENSLPLLRAGLHKHADTRFREFVGALEGLRTEFRQCSLRLSTGTLPKIARISSRSPWAPD